MSKKKRLKEYGIPLHRKTVEIAVRMRKMCKRRQKQV